MMKQKVVVYTMVFLLVMIQSACTSTSSNDNNKIKIYTTIYAIEEFTNLIGGENVEVINLIPSGADAHTYEPTAKQMVDIANAEAFIYVGIGMEGFIEKMKVALEGESVRFVKASEGITLHQEEDTAESHDGHDEHYQHEEDPHIWLDPILAIQLAENIKNALIEIDSDQRELYEDNFSIVKSELTLLNQEFETVVENAKNKAFIVSHGAYGYWEERYGLTQKAITGLSPSHEPSQKQLQEIVDYAKGHQLQYVLFEQNVTPRVAMILQKEIGAEALTLHNLAVRSSESSKEDYFSIMRQNIKTMEKALN
jgi:zinc transport system substrate-binding protein